MKTEVFVQVREHSLYLASYGSVNGYVFEMQGSQPIPVIALGNIKEVDAPLVRIHSRCTYGEVFESMDCDCQVQLHLAHRRLLKENCGVFIYLEQEGRGCGLINKAKAYELKDREGLDTVEAYHRLSLSPDPRDYFAAAQILKYLGLRRVRLLTNNPNKLKGISETGIDVQQEYLRTEPTEYNIDYLRVKQLKLGHDLGLDIGHAKE